MKDLTINHPKIEDDELEVTVFGKGNHNGESILVHFGNNKWIIIDSFIVDKQPVALWYLQKIGVSFENVIAVVCSHWDMDHYLGLPEILANCENAHFYMTAVGEYDKFMQYIIYDCINDTKQTTASKIHERCLKELEGNENRKKRQVQYVLIGTIEDKDNQTIRLKTLSPSPYKFEQFLKALTAFDPNNPSDESAKGIKENMCSMSFCYYADDIHVLLGGDLETNLVINDSSKIPYECNLCDDNSINRDGWCFVRTQSEVYREKLPYSLFKLPHHASITGYCNKMWAEDFGDNKPIAISTVFATKDLPRKNMLEQYLKVSSKLYCTYVKKKTKESQKTINYKIDEDPDVETIKDFIDDDTVGIVICRKKKNDSDWSIDCIGNAKEFENSDLENY